MSTELGSYLRRTLEEKNIARKDLSEQTGISEAAISRLISGQRGKAPSPETMNRLAAGLGVPLEILAEKSGFAFDQKAITQITEMEELIRKFISPILERIYTDEKYLMSLFEFRNIETSPDKAKSFLKGLPPSKQLKFLQDSGFVFSFLNPDDSEYAELKTTFPGDFIKTRREAESLAGEMRNGFDGSLPVVIQHNPNQLQITVADNSIFHGKPEKLQDHVDNLDKMEPALVENLLKRIANSAELFPRSTKKPPDINITIIDERILEDPPPKPEKQNDRKIRVRRELSGSNEPEKVLALLQQLGRIDRLETTEVQNRIGMLPPEDQASMLRIIDTVAPTFSPLGKPDNK